MTRPFRIGLVGLGAIGRDLLSRIAGGTLGPVACTGVLVRRPRAATDVPGLTHDPDRFFAAAYDAVVEGAGHQAVRDHGERALRAGADLVLTSVGALTDDALFERLRAAATESGRRLILPSAGIGALDILAAGAVGGLDRVTVTVRKDPLSWKGTAAEGLVDLDRLTAPVVLHDGPVREGARAYPQNVNISAAAALAGIGLDRTRLVIVADPGITVHVVEIEAEGTFGRFTFREEVIPTDDNPKTGRLVAMAIAKTVRQMASPVVIGA
ncbi:aspartate dehydrogenase [Stella sp.]|uniref:aspartate dehydrogenase n=1 Tax=Stella sp. TaxID=2912054 RepID=UPI0035AE0266